MGSFSGAFIRDFNGGSKSDQIPGSGGHGIRLWFTLFGVFVDCPFLRLRGPIQVIQMIEVIQVSGGSAGRKYVTQGLGWGGRVDVILDFWCFVPGGWNGIFLGFGSLF